MSTLKDEHTRCLAGCGKLVMNSIGICLPCRTTECRDCGRPFGRKVLGETRCADCRSKWRNKARSMG